MLQYASFVGLLKMILIILLVYFGIKILARLFMPFLLMFVSKKVEKRFGGQFQKESYQKRSEKEGEVIIDKVPKTKSSNKDLGDYVDFEEID